MPTSPLLVTGASGKLGRRVTELLLARGAGPIIAATRKPEALADLAARGVEVRRADFESPGVLAAAFAGAKRALLVSTDAFDRPGRRLAQHRTAVSAMEKAGVEHIVYTSLPHPVGSLTVLAPDHAGTEDSIAATKLGFTILRNNLYIDLLAAALPDAMASGALVDARGGGAVAWVTREDCAATAAGALVEGRGRQTYDVTGPESITSADLARIVGEVTGRPFQHVPVTVAERVEGMIAHGLPRPVAEMLASFEAATARGEYATVTDTVAHFSGRAPTDVRTFLEVLSAR